MAERRCFSKKVVESDDFRALSDSCQALYFHLNMAADDDGFLNGAGAIASMSPRGREDLERLVEAGFLLRFGSIYVVKHWRISNTLKSDRIKPLMCPEVAAQVYVKSNRAYSTRADCGGRSLLELRGGCPGLDSQEKRTEEKRTQENTTQARRDFRTLMESYPAHRRDGGGYEAFCRNIHSHEEFEQAMAMLELWKQSDRWRGQQYVPNLSNWLARGLWREKPPEPPERPGIPSLKLGEPELEAIRRVLEEDLPPEGEAETPASL